VQFPVFFDYPTVKLRGIRNRNYHIEGNSATLYICIRTKY